MIIRTPFRAILAFVCCTALLAAQGKPPAAPVKEVPVKDVPAREAEVDQKIVQLLVAFGRSAESYKAPASARIAYEMILDHYDVANPTARAGLGYKRVKDEWKQVTPADKLAADTANAAQQKTVADAWQAAKKKVAGLHRELGVALLAEGVETRGRFQVERALAIDPDDAAAHAALGHEHIDGYYGTADELAFIRRMREISAKARELGSQDYEVKVLPQESMPRELKQSGLPFHGARSKHYTHWVVNDPDMATVTTQWAERAHAMLEFLLPEGAKSRLRPAAMQWYAIVRTNEERDTLFAASPNVHDKYTPEQARLFGGMSFKTTSGMAHISWGENQNDADRCVAHVTKRHCLGGANVGLGEGLVHAMTWMLSGTTLTYYCSLPNTVSGDSYRLPRNPDDWLERLHSDISTGKDWPLVQVPRERSDNFRDGARVKSWSFMVWLLARYPDRWVKVFDALKIEHPMPEDVATAFRTVFEREAAEMEAEWREWARPGSRLARVSGLGN